MAGLAGVGLALTGCGIRVTCQDRIREDGSARRKVTCRTDDSGQETEKELRESLSLECLVLPGPEEKWLTRREEFRKTEDGAYWSFYAFGDFAANKLPAPFGFKSPGHGAVPGFEVVPETHVVRTGNTIRYTTTLDLTPAFTAGLGGYAHFLSDLTKLDFPAMSLPDGFAEVLEAQLGQAFAPAMPGAEEESHDSIAMTIDALEKALTEANVQPPGDLDERLREMLSRAWAAYGDDAEPTTPEGKLACRYFEDGLDVVNLFMCYEFRWELTMPWPIVATNGERLSKTRVSWDLEEPPEPGFCYTMTAEARRPGRKAH